MEISVFRFTPPPLASGPETRRTSHDVPRTSSTTEIPSKLQQMNEPNGPVRKSTKAKWWSFITFLFSLCVNRFLFFFHCCLLLYLFFLRKRRVLKNHSILYINNLPVWRLCHRELFEWKDNFDIWCIFLFELFNELFHIISRDWFYKNLQLIRSLIIS